MTFLFSDARTQEEHDKHLEAVSKRIQGAEGTLNRDKCEFATTGVKFLEQLVNAAGIRANPNKVNAILHVKDPTSLGSKVIPGNGQPALQI